MSRARRIQSVGLLVAAATLIASCGGDRDELTIVTHDAFLVSDEVIDAFEDETGISVTFLTSADVGTLVSEAILTRGDPVADVLFGIDNTFLSRGLDNEIFQPYESPGLASVPEEFQIDPTNSVTPIDYGDVCVNYWVENLGAAPAPTSLDDLTDPAYEGMFVTQNPETSSPGLALLLATVATYGEEGWEEYWRDLRDNDLTVTASWTDAYFGEFVAGGGERPIVNSYASSPVAEVVLADPPVDAPPTGVIEDSCFRQIEFAGILAGAAHPDAAATFIDFMLSDTFQEDVPLNMFVFPVSTTATLPPEFVQFATVPESPAVLDPEVIEANRDDWTARWVEIVLR